MSNQTKSLNQQLNELDELLAWFEKPDIDIDEALKKFDEGIKLTEAIKKRLQQAENKITVLKEKFGN